MEKSSTKGPICGIENCRSRRYDEGEDGFLYCQNGHRQGGLVRGDDDEDNLMTAARTVTRKKKEIDENTKKIAKHFSGRQAFDLYLKSLQLILRRQIWFLVHEQGLPPELETVIYDLWALRIAQLSDKIASDTSESESQSQSQVFNTLETDDGDTSDDERGMLKNTAYRGERKLASMPNLNDTLALCYLGILTLRLPITPGDIYAWVTDGKMAYRRAIKLVPLAMRDRLPATYHAVLDQQTLFKHKRFYNTVTDLQIGYSKDHSIIWPALNVPLLLYRYVREMALPLELYDATTRLADLLGYNFALHGNDKKRLGIRHLPEAQLIGCVLVCVKLLYPLDDRQRSPLSSTEPTSTTLDWDAWCKRVNAATADSGEGNEHFTTEDLIKLQEKDVLSMLPEQLDQYMDFYADAFLDDAEIQRTKENDDFRHALYSMFPIEGHGEPRPPKELSNPVSLPEQMEIVKAVHSSMTPVAAASDEAAGPELLRPGQAYHVWKKEEQLPDRAKVLYEKAAKLAGLSMDLLVKAVFFTEAKIEQWRRQQMTRS
ncbi:hypothetical protein T440DRAFT_490274 [Plenodomus tracheiphilus IPT5]|uniref:Uncharacterized protein n=1 Tax=Plenodomus tracheiphilus IPT5 TaxID=1408161 RepID=A0A6A7B2E0_9PLEO|nr:hypothetical protein T440DRAFT_490274 [Plenodomus tracheiphilus IPT5]